MKTVLVAALLALTAAACGGSPGSNSTEPKPPSWTVPNGATGITFHCYAPFAADVLELNASGDLLMSEAVICDGSSMYIGLASSAATVSASGPSGQDPMAGLTWEF